MLLMKDRKKILLFTDWYEPGYKAGGPIRSCVNFTRHMQQDYDVFVFTSDRDLGASGPYEGIVVNEWQGNQQGSIVYYCSPEMLTWQNIHRQIDVIQPEFIYLNSMFSFKFTIYPLLISRRYGLGAPVVLAPRGMLRESAIRFKPIKKKVFLKALRIFGLHKGIRFHATDATEVRDTRIYFGQDADVAMISNFPGALTPVSSYPEKSAGELSMIFVGRVHPIKNLDLLLKILKEVRANVRLTIVGSLEDEPYWEKCRQIIATLPEAVRVEYAGEVANHALPAMLDRHHLFVLPTRGEIFGHAIFEALAQGKPVLISDQTPWRGLAAAGAGWDLPLDSPERFRDAIEKAAALDQAQYEEWSRSASQFLKEYLEKLNLKEEYQKLFS